MYVYLIRIPRFPSFSLVNLEQVGALRSSLNRTSWDINISSPLGRNLADMFHLPTNRPKRLSKIHQFVFLNMYMNTVYINIYLYRPYIYMYVCMYVCIYIYSFLYYMFHNPPLVAWMFKKSICEVILLPVHCQIILTSCSSRLSICM